MLLLCLLKSNNTLKNQQKKNEENKITNKPAKMTEEDIKDAITVKEKQQAKPKHKNDPDSDTDNEPEDHDIDLKAEEKGTHVIFQIVTGRLPERTMFKKPPPPKNNNKRKRKSDYVPAESEFDRYQRTPVLAVVALITNQPRKIFVFVTSEEARTRFELHCTKVKTTDKNDLTIEIGGNIKDDFARFIDQAEIVTTWNSDYQYGILRKMYESEQRMIYWRFRTRDAFEYLRKKYKSWVGFEQLAEANHVNVSGSDELSLLKIREDQPENIVSIVKNIRQLLMLQRLPRNKLTFPLKKGKAVIGTKRARLHWQFPVVRPHLILPCGCEEQMSASAVL